MDFKENLRLLKVLFKVTTNKELAVKMGLSEDGIKNWIRKKEIPKKHLKLLENNNMLINNIGNNNINGNNSGVNIHGDVHINNIDERDKELCELMKQLEPKEKEYYYHLIKADLLKKNL